MIRLGVNIDHVATVRQARGEAYPDPVQAAVMAELGGADNITAHLREDRRHVQDRDALLLKETIKVPLNFEMAATNFMIDFAAKLRPAAVTLVPEKREERTTEGGLDLQRNAAQLKTATDKLQSLGILVSLFIEPDEAACDMALAIGAGAVEFHTGRFCKQIDAAITSKERRAIVDAMNRAARKAHKHGIQVHLGHGLHYGNANWLQHVEHAEEANIGHAIVGRALFVGMREAVREMKELLNNPALRP